MREVDKNDKKDDSVNMAQVKDRQAAVMVKDVCLGSTAPYTYSKDEIIRMGYTPQVDKPFYTVKRPKEVLQKAAKLFNFAPLCVEHVPDELGPHNVKDHLVGVVGNNIEMRVMEDGNWGLFGEAAFYDNNAVSYIKSGNNMTSADYVSVCRPCRDGTADFEMTEIRSVNNVAITAAGRGGKLVKVADSNISLLFGGKDMAGKSGILSFLGIGSRTKDKDFSFASKVLDAAKGWANLDAAAREKTIGELTGHITHFSEGPEREALIGAMRDSLASPVDALLKEKEVSRIIDGLYNACEQKDEAEAKKTLEAAGIKDAFPPKDKDEKKDKDEDDKDEDDKEKGKAKDAAPFDIDAAIAKAMGNAVGKMTDSISALIDKKVSEALGIKPKSEEKETKTQDSTDDVTLNEETSFLLRGIFGK